MKDSVSWAALFLAVAMIAGCGHLTSPFQNSPGEVVKSFYLDANAGKYSDAEQLLANDADKAMKGDLGQLAGGFKHICDEETKNGTVVRVDIMKEEIRGEGATVTANITYKDGSTKSNDKTGLIKEKGSWKITLGE